MNYKHFTMEDRCCLREYYVKGKSYREITRLLGRNVSSISRELRRNCTFFRDVPRYYPYTPQRKSNLRNSYRHRGMFWSQEGLDYIDEKLQWTWSPEQISKRQEPFEGEFRNAEKEPGVDQRRAQESFTFPNTTRFVPRKSYQVLRFV